MPYRKQCRACLEWKGQRGFYKQGKGREPDCKECKKAAVMDNREYKVEQYREMRRRIYARPEEQQKRRIYAMSERGREVHRRACRLYYRISKVSV